MKHGAMCLKAKRYIMDYVGCVNISMEASDDPYFNADTRSMNYYTSGKGFGEFFMIFQHPLKYKQNFYFSPEWRQIFPRGFEKTATDSLS